MPAPNPQEIWQVEVGGQVYEAPFGELGDWINEGSLLPGDKVRKGNLRWIEARRVPSLVPFFNAKEQGLPMPVVVSTTEAPAAEENVVVEQVFAAENPPMPDPFATVAPVVPFVADPVDHSIAIAPEPSHAAPNPDVCAMHSDLASVYLCDGCGNGFCKACPNSYGGTVKICPLCGAMCRTMTEVVQKKTATDRRTTAIAKGFGAEDFFNALAHPFKFKTSLFFGAIFFMFFSIGQSAGSMGGIYMVGSSIISLMLGNMLTFGVLAHTIDSFTHGHLEANFMPDFDGFELWDNVVHPFFLSIAAYISSFGPFILVLIIGFYLVVSNVNDQMDTFQQKVESIPGTQYYDTQRTVNQSQDVKGVLGDISNQQEQRLADMDEMDDLSSNSAAPVETESVDARTTREQEELWAMAQQHRAKSLEAVVGKSPETQAAEQEAMVQEFLSLAPPLVVIGGIFFLWGLFYMPIACAVAGYTRSFGATINPLVGLDTIKRLGGTYFKILLMGLALLLASMFVGGILALIFKPFDLPTFGNLPAKAIGALFTFYLSVVFSCILGYAMYKKSDKLNIGS